jgi:hypothetical protein
MRFKTALTAAVALGSLAIAGAASAAINAPVPVANYIVYGGLDWAWAGPCAPFISNSCNISGTDTLTAYQASQGWRIPTLAEFLNRPEVPNFGGACASAWFGSGWSHCDFGDPDYPFGQINGVKPHGYLYDYGYGVSANGNNALAETWFVRSGVPEPAAWVLMIAGFGLAGAMLRRRSLVAA